MAKLTIVVEDDDTFVNLYREAQDIKAAGARVRDLEGDNRATFNKLCGDLQLVTVDLFEQIVAIE